MIQYNLIRSRRKTLALHIKDGGVEVRAPLHLPVGEIERFVAAKERWIADKLSISKERVACREIFTVTYGDTVLVRGLEYPIVARDGDRVGFDGACFYLPPDLPPDEIKLNVIEVYRRVAQRLFDNRVRVFAPRMGVTPTAVKINGAKTRWGSCSGKNSLNFSWRLIMADDEAIDYVVVHELAHIKEHNHSDRFWAHVASVLPDYRQRQERLKELQKRLACEDWA